MENKSATVVAIFCAAAVGVAVGMFAEDVVVPLAEQLVVEPQQQISREPTIRPRYRLAGSEGKLAVYLVGKQTPELVFDIWLHHLPDVDRLRLEEGIEIEDYQQLLRLIEDYTS
ncbi:MAG: hypothetical protein RR320_01380 [Oscillospiraceae bacterium]